MKDKSKKANRRKKTFNYAKRQEKIALINEQFTKRPLGYYKKKSSMDCGNPKCGVCGNPRKSKSTKGSCNLTLQEKKNLISFYEF